ncbi:DNA-protecting protein DprA [Shewanella sp. Choline-02u-19]|uniref:DNA-processing protein DprA n=1 Tax=unclassified Shewanella TaxID=196818 RepID=UPI000C34EA60|nr:MULTISPECIES: DNA-processing protein DprA [unclassified Shewanella]PKG58631.1 DNA-protecting protein DprA [Shewanella sp. GutDb-MelDb]PKG75501.1 DNA-protecting protein DprA [Shewanella sp. GutCb]PKH63228.1 DNA-protecting protein DprA [Shewanella sp. Bg11-22]PKI30748.1 DNA-protecting protein DprA [Shewanella sp. Choline-02u-19]
MDVEELRQRLTHEPDALPLPESLLNANLTPDYALVDTALEWQQQSEFNHLLCLADPLYPPLLKQISDPPTVLFIKGNITSLIRPGIAIVGSRNATPGGLKMAYSLSSQLVDQQLCIVSGMALGIDGAAHQAAIDNRGVSIAVLGTGAEVIYPKRHRSIYHDIQNDGCVMTEFWPQVKPYSGNFPKRNRIISGLTLGTLVVEASLKSGSLISARLANEQGREVFAMPGSVLSGQSEGCHQLLRDGAKLVESAGDILEEIAVLSGYHLEEVKACHHIGGEIVSDLPFASLLASVGYETTTIDNVVEHSGKAIELVLEQLLELELQGWVTAVPGGYVRLKRS